MRYSELQQKDVVNVNNGQKVGTIVDIIINNEGKIDSIVKKNRFGVNYIARLAVKTPNRSLY